MGLDRRTFLQQAALALVSLGVSETGINLLGKNSRFAGWLKPYVETLAQTTNRKLALLVGINEYAEKKHLLGCVNDVELQKELLVRCFGFKPQDIYTLTDRQATRENIETAFNEYLTEQANSNDVVLFHFSGYGSQVKISDNQESTEYKLVNSLIPFDSSLPTKGKPATNDLLQETIFALARSLKTDNPIAVFDISFQTTQENLQGNYRVRSYNQVSPSPRPEELAFQENLIRNLDPFRRNASTPGIILSAAEKNQLALEGTWDNFSAGLLTYALTRYLWQTKSPTTISLALQQTINEVQNWSEQQQQPKIKGKLKNDLTKQETNQAVSGGEGFVSGGDVKGMLNVELTALSPVLLDSYHEESCFTVAEADSLLQLRSREGIKGKAQLVSKTDSLSKDSLAGKILQEAIRVLPRNQGLSIALDTHLERIERVDATSAFANTSTVKNSPVAGEGYADCVIGKTFLMVDKQNKDEPHTTEKPAYSYGLYTPRGILIPGTSGEANEVVKLAVKRLETNFENLLAAKWLELIANEQTTQIPVTATLELGNRNTILASKKSLRTEVSGELNDSIPKIESNAAIKLRIDNQSDRDLYGNIIIVDKEAQFISVYAPSTDDPKDNSLKIAANSQTLIPPTKKTWQWDINKPFGTAKIHLILSSQPFATTSEFITQQVTAKPDSPQLVRVSNSLELARVILQDLNRASNVSSDLVQSGNDLYALDVNHWASFNFIYDVV